MTALSTRDALAKAMAEHDWFTPRGYAWPCCPCGAEFQGGEDEAYAHVAGALLAAGAVIDAATLANDETVMDRLWDVLDEHGHNGIDCRNQKPMDLTVEALLRALAAALTERGEGR